ncbi:MAG: protein-L-isoaspartate(D-aspartate) O-methyltransferase [Candidatus Aenigmarchaeota archaeon]|nr:protein-L-isoaspartate(D-aspartate) O-methyltransferase [Candidatus Aenigmarchaeota archaeon]
MYEKTLENLIQEMRLRGTLKSKKLEQAFKKIDRKYFVPEKYKGSAYADYPLPIGHEQTISQPSTVAMMTEALVVKSGQKILEIGAGSGWQAALLGYLVGPKGKIFTVEINEWLVELARRNMKKIGLGNVKIIHGDGSLGYEKEAPYDRIMVTAAAPKVPEPLKRQLKDDGKMIMPLGNYFTQKVLVFEKMGEDLVVVEDLGYFRFVPLKGKHGF